jgi:hypothetical protein
MLAPAGPAVGMEPVCAELTVDMVYAAGPARPATMLKPTAARASWRPIFATKIRPSAPAREPRRTIHFSQGR